jgi:hypothetical protein
MSELRHAPLKRVDEVPRKLKWRHCKCADPIYLLSALRTRRERPRRRTAEQRGELAPM